MNNRDEIKQELLELGFNVNSKGIAYFIDAIEYIKENTLEWETMTIYEFIAKRHNSTISRVERTMRFAIEPAIKNIQEKYRYYYKINTSKFLNLIRIQMI